MRNWLILMQNQWQELVRNPMMRIHPFMAVAITLVMRLMGPDSMRGWFQSMTITFCIYFSGWLIPAMGLAEEREKRTLAATLLAPVHPAALLLSRALLSALITLALVLVILISWWRPVARPELIMLGVLPVLCIAIAGGILTGLLARDVKHVGVYATPVILALVWGSTLPWEHFQPGIWAVQAWLPTRPLHELLQAGTAGGDPPALRHAAVLLAYAAWAAGLCAWWVRRRPDWLTGVPTDQR